MLFIRGGDAEWAQLTPEQMQHEIQKYSAWARSLAASGKLHAANKLTDGDGHIVRMRDGQIVVDGPYTEAKEAIGGYFHISAENYDEAVALARECPGLTRGVVVEVRQLDIR
jgi:hypothetical protein